MNLAIKKLKTLNSEVSTKTYQKNDMVMIFSYEYSIENIKKNLFEVFNKSGDLKALMLNEIKEILSLNSVLQAKIVATELLYEGFLCVDAGEVDLRYYKNLFINK